MVKVLRVDRIELFPAFCPAPIHGVCSIFPREPINNYVWVVEAMKNRDLVIVTLPKTADLEV